MELNLYDRKRAGLLDLLIFFLAFIFPLAGLMAINASHFIHLIISYLYYISFGIFLSKDIFNQSSLFKKIHGIKIIKHKTKKEVSPIDTVFRNSTLILLLPLELIMAFLSPRRRIGDYIFNTQLISTDKLNPGDSWREIKRSKINISMIIAILTAQGISFFSFYILRHLIDLL